MQLPVHPIDHAKAARFHTGLAWYFGVLGAVLLTGVGLCVGGNWFHRTSAERHRVADQEREE